MEADERQEMLNWMRQSAEKCVMYYSELIRAGASRELAVAVVSAWCMPQMPGVPAAIYAEMADAMTRMAPPAEEDDG